jgi:hypothetical protein
LDLYRQHAVEVFLRLLERLMPQTCIVCRHSARDDLGTDRRAERRPGQPRESNLPTYRDRQLRLPKRCSQFTGAIVADANAN